MTPTWSLDEILADPPLSRDQIEQLEAEDRVAGVELVTILNTHRRARRPDPTTLYRVRLQAAREQLAAIKALPAALVPEPLREARP